MHTHNPSKAQTIIKNNLVPDMGGGGSSTWSGKKNEPINKLIYYRVDFN